MVFFLSGTLSREPDEEAELLDLGNGSAQARMLQAEVYRVEID